MKLVKGWGINDADYTVKVKEAYYEDGKRKFKEVWNCPYYQKWLSMLERSFSEKYQNKKSSYVGVTTSPDWKYFSDFKAWMEKRNWEGLQLDKDILIQGNKVYGPDTCCLVPSYINGLIVPGGGKNGLPYGVSVQYRTKNGGTIYIARVSEGNMGPKKLGTYNNPMTAHKAWQEEKTRIIERAIIRYSKESYFDTKVADALMSRVWKLRLDVATNKETKDL